MSSSPPCPTAQARFPNRVRRSGSPQRPGRRCGSRGSSEATGTSPAPSSPDDATGDRETNASAPRSRRREAEPQRGLTGWSTARSRLAQMRPKSAATCALNMRETGRHRVPKERAVTTPKTEPRPAARTRVIMRVPLGVVTAGDPSPQPGPRSGVNGPGPPRPAGGVAPEGFPLGGAWRSQVPTVKGPKSVVQTRSWPRGAASAGCRRSRCPAGTGPRPVPRPATQWRRSM